MSAASFEAERQQLLRDVAVGVAASVQQMTALNENIETMLAQGDAVDAHAANWLRLVTVAAAPVGNEEQQTTRD